MTDFDDFEDDLSALENKLIDTGNVASIFSQDIETLRAGLSAASSDSKVLAGGLSGGLRKAFDGLAFEGLKLSDALDIVAQSAINAAYKSAIDPVADQVGGALAQGLTSAISAILPFANGGSFSQGRVMPFAKGGVVSAPTTFPMRGGVGLMGEAGPEAIMPLSRGADGRLGVRASGHQQPVSVVMNITTPNAESFRQSQSQLSASLSRALASGNRNA
ncbi:MAG: phage tail tape measure protein [Pseudomonadota bacterium]